MPTLTIQITEHVYRGMQIAIMKLYPWPILNDYAHLSIDQVHVYGVGCTELLQEVSCYNSYGTYTESTPQGSRYHSDSSIGVAFTQSNRVYRMAQNHSGVKFR